MYQFLDIFFIVFHTLFTLFNLFGWIWRKTRVWNLITLSLTAFSWLFLGIWFGFGYCPCTDWHWMVRRKLGHFDMPRSYMKFLVDNLTGWDVSAAWVDWGTGIGFLAAFAASLYLNFSREK